MVTTVDETTWMYDGFSSILFLADEDDDLEIVYT